MAGGSVCSRCGALLPLPDAEGRISCLSCGHNTREAVRQPDPPKRSASTAASEADPENPFTTWTPGPGQAPRSRPTEARGRIGCLLAVALMALGLGVAVALVASTVQDSVDEAASPPAGRLTLASSGLVRMDGDPAEVIAAVYDGGADSRSLARIRLGADHAGSVVWRGEEFPNGVYGGAMAVVDDMVFVALDRELWAVGAADGVVAWKAGLPDVVQGSCANCLIALGEVLLVRTADAQVLAFGTGSSEALWRRRLTSPAGRMMPTDAGLAVIDDGTEPGASAVSVLDPRTGSPISTIAPGCDDGTVGIRRDMTVSDQVYAVPGTSDLVATISFGSGCAVRWNAATGQVVWAAPTGDISMLNERGIITADRLVVAGGDGLVSLDLATGSALVMPAPADVTVAPRAQVGELLLAESSFTRGSSRSGLVAYDASGQVRWQVAVPGDSDLLEVGAGTADALFSGKPLTLLVTLDGTLSLVTLDGDSRTIERRPVDLVSGGLGDAEVIELPDGSGTPSVLVHEVTADGLLMTIDNRVVHVDPSGQLAFFPA